jgi:hypothetical protein
LLPRVISQGLCEVHVVQVVNDHIDSHLSVIISILIYMSRGHLRVRPHFI